LIVCLKGGAGISRRLRVMGKSRQIGRLMQITWVQPCFVIERG
jgi:hypothetical protein